MTVIHSSSFPIQRASRWISLLTFHTRFTTFGNYCDWKAKPNSAFSLVSKEAAVSHGAVLDQKEHALPKVPLVSSFWESPLEVFALCKTLTELKPCQPCCPPLLLLNKHAVVAFPPAPGSRATPGPGWGMHWTGTLGIRTLNLYQHLHTTQWTQTTKESFCPPPQQVTPCCISFKLSWANTSYQQLQAVNNKY